MIWDRVEKSSLHPEIKRTEVLHKNTLFLHTAQREQYLPSKFLDLFVYLALVVGSIEILRTLDFHLLLEFVPFYVIFEHTTIQLLNHRHLLIFLDFLQKMLLLKGFLLSDISLLLEFESLPVVAYNVKRTDLFHLAVLDSIFGRLFNHSNRI